MSDSNGLPEGWSEVATGELASSMKNGIYKKKEFYADEGTACLRMYNIQDGTLAWRDIKRMRLTPEEIAEYGLQPGDLLVNRVNSRELVGKTCVIPSGVEPCVYESKNIRLRVDSRVINPKLLNYRLLNVGTTYFRNNLQQTVGMASISQDQLAAFRLPLPPRREQDRIVAKIEELFSDLDAGVRALERAQANLKRYRASVLKAAVEGKLTEEWRAKHPDVEPASELLDRILVERRRRWEEEQLAKYEAKGKKPSKGWRDRYKEPIEPDTSDLPSLPGTWDWASIDQVASDVTVGHVGSMKQRYVSEGIPFLRSQNVRPLRYDRRGLRHVPADFHGELGKSRLIGGELLVVRSGNIGDACVYPEDEPEANCADLVITRFLKAVNSRFAAMFVVSPLGKRIVGGKRTGSALPHFNVRSMAHGPIPLPPVTEQAEIVRLTDEELSKIDAAKAAIHSALKRAARLRQSILKHAFSGKLVPQDPTDEPARELLTRIASERNEAHERNGSTRTKSRTRRTPAKKK